MLVSSLFIFLIARFSQKKSFSEYTALRDLILSAKEDVAKNNFESAKEKYSRIKLLWEKNKDPFLKKEILDLYELLMKRINK